VTSQEAAHWPLADAAVLDEDRLGGFAALRANSFHLLHDVHALNNLTKDYVLAVQPGSLCRAEKELGAVGVLTSIRHRQDSWSSVRQLKVLVLKLVAVDRLSSGPVTLREVTPLTHEPWNDAMELAALVAKPLFSGTESTEVLACLWHNIWSQLHDNTAGRGAADVDIEEAASAGRHRSDRGGDEEGEGRLAAETCCPQRIKLGNDCRVEHLTLL